MKTLIDKINNGEFKLYIPGMNLNDLKIEPLEDIEKPDIQIMYYDWKYDEKKNIN